MMLCVHCKKNPLPRETRHSGRVRMYCSGACKVAAHRARQVAELDRLRAEVAALKAGQ